MARPISELRKKMSVKARAESDRLYETLRRELALNEIRAAAGLSQAEMAARLKLDQPQVSRLERRPDMLVSTLARYVDAAGGRLVVMADLEGKLVELARYGRGEESPRRAARRRRAAKRPA
jgi:transcriptional regulator with XRE-family HTH domain